MKMKTAILFGGRGQDGTLLRNLLSKYNYNIVVAPRFSQNIDDITSGLIKLFAEYKPYHVYYLSAIHGPSSSNINDDYNLIQPPSSKLLSTKSDTILLDRE